MTIYNHRIAAIGLKYIVGVAPVCLCCNDCSEQRKSINIRQKSWEEMTSIGA
jgi:hypothetical protein